MAPQEPTMRILLYVLYRAARKQMRFDREARQLFVGAEIVSTWSHSVSLLKEQGLMDAAEKEDRIWATADLNGPTGVRAAISRGRLQPLLRRTYAQETTHGVARHLLTTRTSRLDPDFMKLELELQRRQSCLEGSQWILTLARPSMYRVTRVSSVPSVSQAQGSRLCTHGSSRRNSAASAPHSGSSLPSSAILWQR